ncbi:MAG TPA: Uma2 family endonuclease [Planctomycetaceae bacterium]|nr:Uma2 family endonuclease [Planctomycetaceae bacterium]
MSTATAASPMALMTAEEYLHRAPRDQPSELIRGRMVVMNPPFSAHGYWCAQITRILGNYVEEHELGRVIGNDGGVVTERDPDTVRGADVAFYSFKKVPRDSIPEGYWPTPELVVEVRSSDDRWPQIYKKVGEYLDAGVVVVCVVDPPTRSLHVLRADQPAQILTEADTFTLPDVLPGFAELVSRIFQ